MPHSDALTLAGNRYHAAIKELQAAFDAAIPPDHPLRVEVREASTALDEMVTDRDLLFDEVCST